MDFGQVARCLTVDGWVEVRGQQRMGQPNQVRVVEADAVVVFPQRGLALVKDLRPYLHGRGEEVVVELLREPEHGLCVLAGRGSAIGDGAAFKARKVSGDGLHKNGKNGRKPA